MGKGCSGILLSVLLIIHLLLCYSFTYIQFFSRTVTSDHTLLPIVKFISLRLHFYVFLGIQFCCRKTKMALPLRQVSRGEYPFKSHTSCTASSHPQRSSDSAPERTITVEHAVSRPWRHRIWPSTKQYWPIRHAQPTKLRHASLFPQSRSSILDISFL